MKEIVILKGPSMDTVNENLMTECLKILFPGCEIRVSVSVAASDDAPLTRCESPM